jgi:hypothetical protein
MIVSTSQALDSCRLGHWNSDWDLLTRDRPCCVAAHMDFPQLGNSDDGVKTGRILGKLFRYKYLDVTGLLQGTSLSILWFNRN